MKQQEASKTVIDPDELDQKQRRDVIRAFEPYGLRLLSDLPEMSGTETAKWFIWNLHENLDELRKLEPTLVAHVASSQLTVSDGQSMWTDNNCVEKRVEFHCNWYLLLKYPAYQNEQAYQVGEGWVDLFVGAQAPQHPALAPRQKGYLHVDSPLYPNQMFLYGWINHDVWDEIKPQLYHPNTDCHTDIFLRDNFLFPVKTGLDFVSGPAGAVGITNLEIRVSSQARSNTWVKKHVVPA